MAETFSSRMASTALRLITAKGEEVVLQRKTHGEMSAQGDRRTTFQNSDARAVMLPGEGENLAEGRTRSGKVLMAAVFPAPETGQQVVFPAGSLSEGAWTIDKAKNLAPQGVLIYSELEVSR